MTPQVQGRKIAFLGASGRLGAPTLKALLAQGIHKITAIQRYEATSSFPPEVTVHKGNLTDEAFLAEVLKGHDVLLLMPPMTHIEIQKSFVRAAAKVGIPYIFPAEFGSDPFAKPLLDQNILLQQKEAIRDLIDELGISSWICISSGPWLDFCLNLGLWAIDPTVRKATIWSGAVAKANMATVQHTAEATAAVLTLPKEELAEYKRKAVYVSSWNLSQREILDGVQRATGTAESEWDVSTKELKDVMAENETKIQAGDVAGFFSKFVVTHIVEGYGGDYEHKVDRVQVQRLEQLGLQKEDLVDAIKKALNH